MFHCYHLCLCDKFGNLERVLGKCTHRVKFKHFKKAIGKGRLKKHLDPSDKIVVADMEMVHGGKYWATIDGGILAIPYDSKKFVFEEWC